MIKIKNLKDEEIEKIKGGATITVWGGLAIAAIVVFLTGVVEGIVYPERCT